MTNARFLKLYYTLGNDIRKDIHLLTSNFIERLFIWHDQAEKLCISTVKSEITKYIRVEAIWTRYKVNHLKDVEIFHFARSLAEIRLYITDVIIWWQLRVLSLYQRSDNLTLMIAVRSALRQSQKLRRHELYNWATRLTLPFRILIWNRAFF